MFDVPDYGGYEVFSEAFARGLEPDPELRLDEWSEKNIKIPKDLSSRHGAYRCAETVGAREVLQWLSPWHPARRVVLKACSQFMKTQLALNVICGWMDAAPANILALQPTQGLAKRFSGRIGKTIASVDSLRDKVAVPRSRDSRNTLDTKEYEGGTLYIATSGSAANLAEIMVKYLYCDEIERWDMNVGGEGDSVKIAENRTTTYRDTRKMYYSSSPLLPGGKIIDLYEMGTQCVIHVPCPHCGTLHQLLDEHLHCDDDLTRAWMVCPDCGAEIDESQKLWMLERYQLHARAAGDGETESLEVSAHYMPPGGGMTWLDLARERAAAEAQLAAGGEDPHKLMQAYVNTRCAQPYMPGTDVAAPMDLANRAEDYPERTVPMGGLILTMGVDVQHDRLAVIIRAWGRGEESWLVYWGELPGQTLVAGQGAWLDLEGLMLAQYRHACGALMAIKACSIDSGDGASQDAVYAYVRKHQHGRVQIHACKGVGDRSDRKAAADQKREIFTQPKDIDVNSKHKAYKYGVRLYTVGTNVAKALLLISRLPLEGSGPGRMHWYREVRGDYFDQLTSEVQVPGKRGGPKVWQVKAGVRNEGLDCEVLALHAARGLRTHVLLPHVWDQIEASLRQSGLFGGTADSAATPPIVAVAAAIAAARDQAPAEPTPVPPAPVPAPAAKPNHEPPGQDWLSGNHDNWLD